MRALTHPGPPDAGGWAAEEGRVDREDVLLPLRVLRGPGEHALTVPPVRLSRRTALSAWGDGDTNDENIASGRVSIRGHPGSADARKCPRGPVAQSDGAVFPPWV